MSKAKPNLQPADKFDFQHLIRLLEQTHQQAQSQANRAINRALVVRNWLFGWYIVEFEQNGVDRAEYGKETLKRISSTLQANVGKGFSVQNLELMRRFFNGFDRFRELGEKSQTLSGIFETGIRQTLSVESSKMGMISQISETLSGKLAEAFTLSWSHYVALLTVANADARRFYEIESYSSNWSVRELERQIGSSLYERLAISRDKDEVRKLAQQGQVIARPADLIKDPLVLEFLELPERASYSESDLESAIIDKLESFLLELGKGFLFEARQKRFTFDNDHYYIDLVFYNRLLRCFVLLDLKIGKLTHQDLGQMQMYVNYYDRHVKSDDELPTIGIVLCAEKNHAVVELTLPDNSNIFASKYQLYLPSKSELQAALESITTKLEASGELRKECDE
jgi:predicted nuclease of restriction endonuclease-like (RecB) superfamily